MSATEVMLIISELNNICTLLSEKYQLDAEGKVFIEKSERIKKQLCKKFPYDSNQEDLYNQIKQIELKLQDIQHQRSEINKIYEILIKVNSDNEKIIQASKENIHKQDTCPLLKEKVNEEFLNFLTLAGEKKKGINYIKDFTKDAEELIIIDPYILSINSRMTKKNYLDDFLDVINFDSNQKNLQFIRLIYDKNKCKSNSSDEIFKDICNKIKPIKIIKKHSEQIHDRIWIKNQKSAIFIGTSLNGLGNKLSISLLLPEVDFVNVIIFLNSENLLND
jgi:hypothetical protein